MQVNAFNANVDDMKFSGMSVKHGNESLEIVTAEGPKEQIDQFFGQGLNGGNSGCDNCKPAGPLSRNNDDLRDFNKVFDNFNKMLNDSSKPAPKPGSSAGKPKTPTMKKMANMMKMMMLFNMMDKLGLLGDSSKPSEGGGLADLFNK